MAIAPIDMGLLAVRAEGFTVLHNVRVQTVATIEAVIVGPTGIWCVMDSDALDASTTSQAQELSGLVAAQLPDVMAQFGVAVHALLSIPNLDAPTKMHDVHAAPPERVSRVIINEQVETTMEAVPEISRVVRERLQ